MDKEEAYSNFGYKKVQSEYKEGLVGEIFSQVAEKYDLMNNLMSFGIHHLWKNKMMIEIPDFRGKLIDVAGRTGDIAFRFYNNAKHRSIKPQIVVTDINAEMLKICQNKAIDSNILSGIEFLECNAEKLPFDDNSFDYYTISFGIRNITNIDAALKEAYRVLKPFGKFICLEFSKIKNPIFENFYRAYSFNIVPKIGKIVASNEDAYRYLVESIDLFPDQDSFLSMIEKVGFCNVKYKNLSLGISSIHIAYKI